MKRNFEKLREGPFDLLVIGGGIYGAWVAYEGALRGLKTALVEKKDWASGTSSASSKLIHGGLRYLEHYWLDLVKKSLGERRRLLSLGPHRVSTVRFLLPLYQGSGFGRISLGIGLSLYDRMGGTCSKISPHRFHSREEMLKIAPYLSPENLTGGFSYTDCETDDSRFTLEIVSGAVQAGAMATNYAKAVELVLSGNKVMGAVMEDLETGDRVELLASVTVNAAGPWAWNLAGMDNKIKDKVRLFKGVHLVMPPLPGGDAVLLTAPSDGRVFFLIPWQGSTLIGTTDTDFQGDPDHVEVDASDEEYLLNAANHFLQGVEWSPSHVRGRFAGLRVLQNRPGKKPSDVTRDWELSEPRERLLVSLGGKMTSARLEAAATLQRVEGLLGKKSKGRSPTETLPLPWFPEDMNVLEEMGKRAGLDPETALWCVRRYGSTTSNLMDLIHESPGLAERIEPNFPFCKGEIVHAVKNEMARTLEDILRRRISLCILTKMEKETVRMAADLAGEILGWDEARREREVRSVLDGGAE